jgi:hypothetical protein
VRACEFTADGKHLLLASVRGELVLWPLAALEPGADPLVGFPYRGALEFGR